MVLKMLALSLVLMTGWLLAESTIIKCLPQDANDIEKRLKEERNVDASGFEALDSVQYCVLVLKDKKTRDDHKENCEAVSGVLAPMPWYPDLLHIQEREPQVLGPGLSFYYGPHKVPEKWEWVLDSDSNTYIKPNGSRLHKTGKNKFEELRLTADAVKYIKDTDARQPTRRELVLYVSNTTKRDNRWQWESVNLAAHNELHRAFCQVFIYDNTQTSGSSSLATATPTQPETETAPATSIEASYAHPTTSLPGPDTSSHPKPVPEDDKTPKIPKNQGQEQINRPESSKSTDATTPYVAIMVTVFGVLLLIAVILVVVVYVQSNRVKKALAKHKKMVPPNTYDEAEGADAATTTYFHDNGPTAPTTDDKQQRENEVVQLHIPPAIGAEPAAVSKTYNAPPAIYEQVTVHAPSPPATVIAPASNAPVP